MHFDTVLFIRWEYACVRIKCWWLVAKLMQNGAMERENTSWMLTFFTCDPIHNGKEEKKHKSCVGSAVEYLSAKVTAYFRQIIWLYLVISPEKCSGKNVCIINYDSDYLHSTYHRP